MDSDQVGQWNFIHFNNSLFNLYSPDMLSKAEITVHSVIIKLESGKLE